MNGMKKTLTGMYVMLAVLLVSIKGRPTRGFSSGAKTLVLAAVVLLVAAGTVSAAPCPAPGNTDIAVSCHLDQPWTVPAGEYGYKITADNVVIDGRGHKITGDVMNSDCWIGYWPPYNAGEGNPAKHSGIWIDDRSGAVVKDLEIEGFCTGIALGSCTDATVDGCDIHNNGGVTGVTQGIHMAYSDHCTITKNDIHDNLGIGDDVCGCGGSGNGIFMYGGDDAGQGDWNTFTYNELHDNTKGGFFTKKKCMHNNISYNNATGNGLGGIILRCMMTNYNIVHHNNASDNCGVGIFIRGNHNLFWNNTICNNMNCSAYRPGGACQGQPAGQVAESGGCGVKVQADAGNNNTLDGNTSPNVICYNEDWDIYDDNDLQGDNNYCTITYNYYDDSADNPPKCVYPCPCNWDVDLRVIDKYETWHNDTHYNVTYTVKNVGVGPSQSSEGGAGIYINGALKDTQAVGELGAEIQHTNTSGPHLNSGANGIDQIKVCADIHNDTYPEDETNNCMNNTFGGPDLKIEYILGNWTAPAGDPSLKKFSVDYAIKNVGHKVAPQSTARFYFYTTTHDLICSKDVGIPELGAGVSTGNLIVGQFTLPDPIDSYIECDVDVLGALVENNEDNNFMQTQDPSACYRECGQCGDKPGGCGKCLDGGCGDVNCDGGGRGGVDMLDYDAVYDFVANKPGATLSCEWAGDTNRDGTIDMLDYDAIYDFVANKPGATLSCCSGGCPP